MKKVVILAMAAVMACVVNASSVSWSFTSANTYANYNVYLVTELASGGFEDVADIQSYALGSSGNSGTLAAGRKAATVAGSASGLSAAEGDTVDFYYVIVNPNDTSAGYWTLASSATAYETSATHTDSAIGATDANALLSSAATAWKTSGGGESGGTPEPTSGLLMLVGGAMLALRRKQK